MQYSEIGGKAKNLILLQEAGYPVPEFVVLNKEDIETRLKEKIDALKKEFTEDVLFAVRSSASVEDSVHHSFAGQFTTHLNIPFKLLEGKIGEVYASRHNESVLKYAQTNSINTFIEMSIIVQRMVSASKAGVAFGANPINGAKNEKVIAVVEGLGDKLVDGRETGEQYLLRGNEIIERGNLLDEEEIRVISKTLDQLQKLFNNVPQDIEFAFEKDQFYLLQSRPITTLNLENKEEIIWDNSNIVESYPGLTLPLTFSFIEKMYEAVYRQFSLVLGISKYKVDANADTFKNMLGLLNGRVYYNLNSWFRSIALLPGYALNADFMEKMMGVKEKIDIDFSEKGNKDWKEYFSVFKAIIGLVRNLKNARKGAKQFIEGFESVYEQFDKKDYDRIPINQIIKDYKSFEQLMVQRWKAPLVNDLFAMIYFGVLQKMTTKIDPNVHNKLIAGSDDIITTEPMKLLPQIAKQISENELLHHMFLTKQASEIWLELNNGLFAAEFKSIQHYINRWGDRSLAELKLETITYRQQPELLIAVLKHYVAQKVFSYNGYTNIQMSRNEAEDFVKSSFKNQWLKKILFAHALKNARYFVSNRENLRYYRTKAFGMVRRMMLSIDKQLYEEEIIENERDIFYLKIEEVLGLTENNIVASLKQVIASRKAQYLLFEQQPLPQRLKTKGKKNLILDEHPIKQGDTVTNVQLLKGTPCSEGIVSAKVLLIKDISEINDLKGCILTTYSTDPGWVVLFPTCSGILTERGSMLSHAAIVSREMGIPCIVGIEHLMDTLKNGDDIVMDGSTGLVKILSSVT